MSPRPAAASHLESAIRAVNHVAISLLGFEKLDALIEEALARVMQVMHTEAGAVHLLDERTHELRLAAHVGLPDPVVGDADRIVLGEGLPGWVAQNGEPLIVDDLTADPRVTRRMARAEGFRGFACVPLKTPLKTYGTLQVITREQRRFYAEDVDLLRAIGTQVGLGIENGRLILELRDRIDTESLRRQIGAAITEHPDWSEMLPLVAGALGRGLRAARCVVLARGYGAVPRLSHEYAADDAPALGPALRALLRRLWRDLGRRTAAAEVGDVAALDLPPGRRVELAAAGIGACLVAPLNANGGLAGLVLLEARDRRPWPADTVLLVEGVAHQLALALDRTRLDAELRASERQFRDLVETARDLILQIDRRGRIVYANPVLAALVDVSPAEACQLPAWSLPFVHPDDRTALRDHVEAVMTGRPCRTTLDYRLLHRDGRTVRWVSQSSSLLRGPGGEVRCLQAFIRDVTEDRQLQQQMLEANRLADLGRLAALMAHEIRNPLGAIVSCIDVLQHDPSTHVDPRLLKVTLEEAAHLNTVLTDLLTFAKPSEPEVERFELDEVVQDTLRLFEPYVRSRPGVDLSFHRDPVTPPVRGDRHHIRHLLWNLLINGLDALPADGGQLRVTLGGCTDAAGGWTILSVADTGHGIPESVRAQIFEPFFTTKASGTGLGLAIVHRVARDHGGRVEVDSGDRGTTFSVHLPADAPHPLAGVA